MPIELIEAVEDNSVLWLIRVNNSRLLDAIPRFGQQLWENSIDNTTPINGRAILEESSPKMVHRSKV